MRIPAPQNETLRNQHSPKEPKETGPLSVMQCWEEKEKGQAKETVEPCKHQVTGVHQWWLLIVASMLHWRKTQKTE